MPPLQQALVQKTHPPVQLTPPQYLLCCLLDTLKPRRRVTVSFQAVCAAQKDVWLNSWRCADTHEAVDRLEEEDADPEAGTGVLAPGRAAAKAVQQNARDSTHKHGQAGKAAGDAALPSVPGEPGQRAQGRAKEHTGFEEVPMQMNGAGSSDNSDSDSDAGLAAMDDHSRAEVCATADIALPWTLLCMLRHPGC